MNVQRVTIDVADNGYLVRAYRDHEVVRTQVIEGGLAALVASLRQVFETQDVSFTSTTNIT